MGMVLCLGILGTFDSGLKSRVGILKKWKKRKKSYKMTKKRGKKEKKEEKLKKMMQKDVLYKHVSSACLTGGEKKRNKIPRSKELIVESK